MFVEGPMDMDNQKKLQTLQMSFIGTILSTYTHEMKNHLAIIKESSGLIQDMIEMGKLPRKKKDAGPFLATLRSIDDQVERSTAVINILNRFGHRMDRPASTFNVHEILEELIVLMNRLAQQKGISLTGDFQKGIPAVRTNPYRIQLIVYTVIREKLEALDIESSVVLGTALRDDSVTIEVREHGNRCHEARQEPTIPLDLFQHTIKELKGDIAYRTEDHRVWISIPLTE